MKASLTGRNAKLFVFALNLSGFPLFYLVNPYTTATKLSAIWWYELSEESVARCGSPDKIKVVVHSYDFAYGFAGPIVGVGIVRASDNN
jgi:hypothetical protein